jgi:hypothetical protein
MEQLTQHTINVAYNKSTLNKKIIFGMLLKFLTEQYDYKPYTFYITLAFIKYVCSNTDILETTVQNIVCDIFLKIISLSSLVYNFDTTKHILQSLKNYTQISSLLLKVNDIQWLALLSLIIKRKGKIWNTINCK